MLNILKPARLTAKGTENVAEAPFSHFLLLGNPNGKRKKRKKGKMKRSPKCPKCGKEMVYSERSQAWWCPNCATE